MPPIIFTNTNKKARLKLSLRADDASVVPPRFRINSALIPTGLCDHHPIGLPGNGGKPLKSTQYYSYLSVQCSKATSIPSQ